MKESPGHRCEVTKTPIEGVYATTIESLRSYDRHSHASFGFGLIEHGAQRSLSGRGEVEAFAGDIITTNPGEVHDGRPHDGKAPRRWRMVYLETSALARLIHHGTEGCAAEQRLGMPVIRDGQLGRMLRRLFGRIDRMADLEPRSADSGGLACEEALAQVGALLFSRYGNCTPGAEIDVDIRHARDRLAAEWLSPPSLSDLARPLGLSGFQLLRRFEKAYGLPPHQWLIQQRVEHARHLIGNGTSLSDAALSSGFADQSHLNRCFVARLGYTPGAWKRRATARADRNIVQDGGRKPA